MEVHDHRRGPPHEEPPLQADAGAEHALRGAAPPAAHGHAAAEQAARAVGAAQLPAALHLQELLHLRAVVQRALRHYRREGIYQLFSKFLCTRFPTLLSSSIFLIERHLFIVLDDFILLSYFFLKYLFLFLHYCDLTK